MKIVKTTVIVGSLVLLAVAEPAFAEMRCEDFTRNSDGSWTPLRPFTLNGPAGLVQVDPGHNYSAGMHGVFGKVAKHLALTCPGVPRKSTHVQPPMRPQDPYLISKQPTSERRRWVSRKGEVIYYSGPAPTPAPATSPSQESELPSPTSRTVIVNPAPINSNPASVDLKPATVDLR